VREWQKVQVQGKAIPDDEREVEDEDTSKEDRREGRGRTGRDGEEHTDKPLTGSFSAASAVGRSSGLRLSSRLMKDFAAGGTG
jgi:hypothetical protein